MKRSHCLFIVGILLSCFLLSSESLYAQGSARFFYNAMKTALARQQQQFVETAWMHNIDVPFFQNVLTKSSFFAVRDGSLLLSTFAQPSFKINIPSTDSKWIFSNVYYPNVFSKPEKTLLLHESAPIVKLGQIAFLYDRHAALFTQLNASETLKDGDLLAFHSHQERLQKLFWGLHSYYRQYTPEQFATALFPKEQIPSMAQQPLQANAVVFSDEERAIFAQLPTIGDQQQWVQQNLQSVYQDLGYMQEQGKTTLGDVPFARYYTQKMRYDYLQVLNQSLQRFPQKRSSLLIRYRQPLPALGGILATDAERLGYARFQADSNPTQANLAEYTRLYDECAPYAAAEVFEKPYEFTLQRGTASIFLLGEEESSHLSALSPSQIFAEMPAKITDLQTQLTQISSQQPKNLDFYKQYYRLTAQLDIYNSLLKRAEFFMEHNIK